MPGAFDKQMEGIMFIFATGQGKELNSVLLV
jgi:hypothetical protein